MRNTNESRLKTDMSSFGSFGSAAPAAAPAKSQTLATARYELEGVNDLFNRMSDMCFKKCVQKYNAKDLALPEQTCIDRCVVKYMDVQVRLRRAVSVLNRSAATQTPCSRSALHTG
jgi:import inner membrane translocase subunit TIM10